MSKLVVVSFDALVAEDMALFSKLPNYTKYMAGASGVTRLRSIYPTVTYPAHASIMTGAYPDKHGVVDNSELHIGMAGEMPWNWFARALKCEDIFTLAKRAGLTTAAVFWPVTGCHADIDYLVDEYWPCFPGDTVEQAHLRSGTPRELYDAVVKPYLDNYVPRKHSSADDFVMRVSAEIIRRYSPDLIMIHPADIDAARHASGAFSERVSARVCAADEYLGLLARAVEDAGVLDETTFVVMSDHGQMDIKRAICLNAVFAENGLLTPREDGSPAKWDAYVKSTGMSAQVYVKDKSRLGEVGALLDRLCEEGVWGVSRVFTREEAEAEERLSGDFEFVLETDGYTSFSDSCLRPFVRAFDFSDYRTGRATHGYLPDKGPQPVFHAAGPAVRPGVFYPRRPIVDVAPTLAKMLGFEMPNADGAPLIEMLAR